ncbi:hypothetical protein KNE206_19340 [Kitasatospora sp. NE20-6]|uniref:hypothetical protein n=1 Tax=Kitasatospora sp. NE20-6 TaxID=2859066 RepID=UPI0034DB8298
MSFYNIRTNFAAHHPTIYSLVNKKKWIGWLSLLVAFCLLFWMVAYLANIHWALDILMGFRSPFDRKEDPPLDGWTIAPAEALAIVGWFALPILAGAAIGVVLSFYVDNLFMRQPELGQMHRSLNPSHPERQAISMV